MKTIRLALLWLGLVLALVTPSPAADNTIVRFQLRNGVTVFGNIDVELYDNEKPLTVSNFLYYVRSGAFDHSIIHRAVPGFILQGGQYTVPNPYFPTAANHLNRIVEGAPIPSELTNSRVIPNTFGTLAMALSGDENGPILNSATTSWFFNTIDNEDDLSDYTVFGKVKSGQKFLTYFNALREDRGLINMFGINYLSSSCDLVAIDGEEGFGLSFLPVVYQFFDCPLNNDLFNVTISVLSSPTNTTDSAAPVLAITSPARNATVTTNAINASGTIRDNISAETITFYTSYGAKLTPVIEGTTWSLALSNFPAAGSTFVVEAEDANGNRVTAQSSFTYEVKLPIAIFAIGSGTGKILGLTNGQNLVIGKAYTITGKPDPANFFIAWLTNSSTANGSLSYTFTMATNLALAAQFETNLFFAAQGTYSGLFNPTNDEVALDNSGFFSLKVNDRGVYSAKISVDGGVIPFSGAFGYSGFNTHFLFNHPKLPGFTRVQLAIDLLGESDQVTGLITNFYSTTVSNFVATNLVVTNFTTTNIVATNLWVVENISRHWKSVLTADRATFNARLNPALQAGKYTVVLPHDTNSASGPDGDGYGTVNVSTAGGITFAGALPDGTKVTQKTSLSKNGEWPLFASLYKGKGSLISWVTFTDQPDSDLTGLFNWLKQSQPAKSYASGITNEATLTGSRFTPNSTNNILSVSNALLSFVGGNLAEDFTNAIAIDPKNKVSNLASNKLSLKLNKANGTFSGSVTPPAGGKAISFRGAILQQQTNGAGFLLGTNRSSRVELLGN